MTNSCHVCGIGDGSFVLHTRPRSKGSFFPFLSTSNKSNRKDIGLVGCCAVCKAFLKEQWNSFEKLKIPIFERTYWVKSWGNNEDDESCMSGSMPDNGAIKKVFKTEKVDDNDRLKTPDNNMRDYTCHYYADINASPLHFNGSKKRKLSNGFGPNIKKAKNEDNINIKDYSIERLTKEDSSNIISSEKKIDLEVNKVLDLSKPLKKQNYCKCLTCSCDTDGENNKENKTSSTCTNCFFYLKNTQKNSSENSLQNVKVKSVQHNVNNDVPILDVSSLLSRNGFKRCGTLHQNEALQNALVQSIPSISSCPKSADDDVINTEGNSNNANNKINYTNKTIEVTNDVGSGNPSIDSVPLTDTLHAALGLIFLQHSQQHLKTNNMNNHNICHNESSINYPTTTQQIATKQQLTTTSKHSSQTPPQNTLTHYKLSNNSSQLVTTNKEIPSPINSMQTSTMHYGNYSSSMTPNRNMCINNDIDGCSTINNNLNSDNTNNNYLNNNDVMHIKKECGAMSSNGGNVSWPGVEKVQEMYQSYLHGLCGDIETMKQQISHTKQCNESLQQQVISLQCQLSRVKEEAEVTGGDKMEIQRNLASFKSLISSLSSTST